MTVTEHLAELRSRLIVSLMAFATISVGAFVLFEPISDALLRPLCLLPPERLGPQGCDLIATGATEPFRVRLKVTTLAGIILSSPVWLYQLWAFVVPALKPKEKRYALPFLLASAVLFLVGAAVAYLTLPKGLNVLIALGGENFELFLKADEYLSFVGLMLLGFGVLFELPLAILFLGLAGIVTLEQMRGARKGAFVGIVALSALVTPSQDPYTLFALAFPLYGLYELTLLVLAARARKSRPRESV